jgi:diguanylate cyclase (GGDEF)-like protein/PAS domain S-box-containing protein
VTDANKVIIHVNQAFCRILGYHIEEVLGQKSSFFRSGQHEDDFYENLWTTVAAKGYWQSEMIIRHKQGKLLSTWHSITAVADANGINTHYVGFFVDISEQKNAIEKLEQLAFYDPLTQLPNRRLLKDRLHLALSHSTRSKQYGVLLFIDLDKFKTLNDTLGHKMGDLLLQQVAQRLICCIRDDDTAARLGGDEFVVMMEDLGENAEESVINAAIAGKKILLALGEPYTLAGQNYHCSASIGASLFYSHSVAEDDLLKHADIAMYQAKQTGRNQLCFFDASMQSVLMERAALETDLRCALGENQFKLYYQLQITHEGHIVGAEVLLRWQHPERGLVMPSVFIPVAEDIGLMLPIGHWVMETVCAQIKIWENQPHTRHLQLAVNVSANRFHQPGIVSSLQAALEKSAINPSRLKLELTESLLIKDVEDAIIKMQALKALGVSLSLDDFGTGYSSLSYLTQLPLDQLKIDQSFVHNIGVKHSDAVIVSTIIAMAKSLNMEVIAEGVETQAQRDFLNGLGCNLYQGYLFSKPVLIDEFEALLGLGTLH